MPPAAQTRVFPRFSGKTGRELGLEWLFPGVGHAGLSSARGGHGGGWGLEWAGTEVCETPPERTKIRGGFFCCEGGGSLALVAGGGCGVSDRGDTQSPPGQPAPGHPA